MLKYHKHPLQTKQMHQLLCETVQEVKGRVLSPQWKNVL